MAAAVESKKLEIVGTKKKRGTGMYGIPTYLFALFSGFMHTHNNPNIIQYLSTLFAHEITISTLLSYQFFLQLCRFEAHLYPVEV